MNSYKIKEEDRIIKILSILNKTYPDAKTGLDYRNAFELLIATILSAQCTDVRVNKVTKKLFEKYKVPGDFARADIKELQQDIKECGLYRNKSKNIKKTSQMLIKEHDGKVPADFDELTKLPGVGRKTANVVLANAFLIPTFAVDTHVFRLARRLGFSDKKDVIGVEKDLTNKIPKKLWIKSHHLLIHHGRNICKARNPLCDRCPVETLCPKNDHKS